MFCALTHTTYGNSKEDIKAQTILLGLSSSMSMVHDNQTQLIHTLHGIETGCARSTPKQGSTESIIQVPSGQERHTHVLTTGVFHSMQTLTNNKRHTYT